jgi:hypothetical protein
VTKSLNTPKEKLADIARQECYEIYLLRRLNKFAIGEHNLERHFRNIRIKERVVIAYAKFLEEIGV